MKVAVATAFSLAAIGHDGSIAGCDALTQTYVDDGVTITVLTNTNRAAHPLEAKIAKIVAP